MLSFLLAACTPDEPATDTSPSPDDDTELPSETGTPDTTGTTGTTGDTATTDPEPAFDCTNIPSGPFEVTPYNISTTEDFDFDALGSLVYSDWTNFVAVDSNGQRSVVAPGIQDTRGIQILSDGNIAAAYISEGRLGFTDRATGASVTLLAGLSGPNALDIGDNDVMYVTETGGWVPGGTPPRVISFDPATGERVEIARGFTYPNGIALNEQQDTLYVADSTSGVYRIRKDESGNWGQKELLFNPPNNESYDGIETDICGNVYVVQFYNGELYRFDPSQTPVQGQLLIDLNDQSQFLWNSIRWGSGRGIWERDTLYVTDRNKVFGVKIGVPGRTQPVDQMP